LESIPAGCEFPVVHPQYTQGTYVGADTARVVLASQGLQNPGEPTRVSGLHPRPLAPLRVCNIGLFHGEGSHRPT
jgi:hypothetical protein